MNFLKFRRKRVFKLSISCLSLLFILNISAGFSSSPKNIKKTDDQNIVFLDLNCSTNILIDNTKSDKRLVDKTAVIKDIRNYLDNSFNVIFNKYHASIKNILSASNPSRTFITALFSTWT